MDTKDYFAEQGLAHRAEPAHTHAVVKTLAGQKAIVTGANSGIGRAVALALGDAGADVVVNYVSREEEAGRGVRGVPRCGAEGDAPPAGVSSEAGGPGPFAPGGGSLRTRGH